MFGFLNLTLWGYLLTGLVLTQITTAAVTIYLHRYQTHRQKEESTSFGLPKE